MGMYPGEARASQRRVRTKSNGVRKVRLLAQNKGYVFIEAVRVAVAMGMYPGFLWPGQLKESKPR
jgi:hypothetical protein